MTHRRWRIGVDSGGTFTDVCLADTETGEVRITKVPSTPGNPDAAIVAGIEKILAAVGGSESVAGVASDAGQRFTDIAYFAHGTTVATNTVIQRNGARTAVVTTAGFRDLLELRRQRRPDLYDLRVEQPAPLVPRALRFEVTERVRYDGSVLVPLRDEDVRSVARAIRDSGVEAVAVCLLYSYLRPEHERRVKEILTAECPGLFVSLSHEVLPEFREYERLSTVVVNAYLGPIMSRYLERLGSGLRERDLEVPPHVTQSNGGIISFEQAATFPARTVLSGPSTGVVGAAHTAALSGERNLITLDMGGTSTDVALVDNGEMAVKTVSEIDGFPVKAPMVDVNAVGAGGGSLAWIDRGGHLKVGPRSVGAVPGPACYGLGNDEPTVTDANVVLGRLNPEYLLAGDVRIDLDAARRSLERLGARLGMDATAAAEGILRVATANMAKAVRVISVQRGYDLRGYTLVAFGGGGPLHAAALAEELGVRKVLVPSVPGVLSAFGLLVTDLRNDFSATHRIALEPENLTSIDLRFQGLEESARRWLDEEHVAVADRRLARLADLRYVGQNYELTVPVSAGEFDEHALAALRKDFEASHERTYGFTLPDEPIELITLRTEAIGQITKADVKQRTNPSEPRPETTRQVYFGERDGWRETPVIQRTDLITDEIRQGPLVVEQLDTTTVVPPGMWAYVDGWDNLVLAPDHVDARTTAVHQENA